MSLLRRLLLLPLLAPLLAVLVIGAVNPRPPVRLRLLIWTSPPLPIGVWLMLAAGGGALLSAGSTTLALRGPGPTLQRQVVREMWPEREPRPAAPAEAQRGAQPVAEPGWEREPAAAPPSAGPSRPPGEPAPTVAVAYRVIRRPPSPRAPGGEDRDGDGWERGPGEEW